MRNEVFSNKNKDKEICVYIFFWLLDIYKKIIVKMFF